MGRDKVAGGADVFFGGNSLDLPASGITTSVMGTPKWIGPPKSLRMLKVLLGP